MRPISVIQFMMFRQLLFIRKWWQLRFIRVVFVIIPLLSISYSGIAQNEKQFHFDHYGMGDGLSQNTVSGIVQDTIGFIWLATQYGLNRFDGHDFRVYAGKEYGFESSDFQYLTLDSTRNSIWLAVRDHLYVFDPCSEVAKQIMFPEGQSIRKITALTLFEEKVWIGTDQGIYWSQLASWEEQDTILNKTPGSDAIQPQAFCVFQDRLLVGGGNELYQLISTNEIAPLSLKTSFEDSVNITTMVSIKDALWIGTLSGTMYQFKVPSNSASQSLLLLDQQELGDEITTVLPGDNGWVWIGHRNQGISIFASNTGKPLHQIPYNYKQPSSLSHNFVLSLWRDREDGIWVGTFAGGVNRYDENKHLYDRCVIRDQDSNRLKHNLIWSMWQDSADDRYLWLGMQNEGVVKYDLQEKRAAKQYPLINSRSINGDSVDYDFGISVYSLKRDNRGQLWAGTIGHGVHKLDESANRFQLQRYPGYFGGESASIRCMLPIDTLGGLLMGTDGNGLYYQALSDSVPIQDPLLQNSIGNFYCFDLTKDPSRPQAVWIATKSHGLIFRDFRKGIVQQYLLNSPLFSISVDPGNPDIIWIGTEGKGLQQFQVSTETFSSPFPESLDPEKRLGVLFNVISNPKDSSLWLVGLGGLARWISHKGDSSLDFFEYGREIPGQEFVVGSYWLPNEGPLYLAQGLNGLLKMDIHRAEKVAKKQVKATPLLTQISLNKEDSSKKLVLNPNCGDLPNFLFSDQSVHLQTSGLSFRNPAELSYDVQIIRAKNDTVAPITTFDERIFVLRFFVNKDFIFSLKKEQTYQVKVRSKKYGEADFIVGNKTYDFVIERPWYLQWWFLAFVVLLILGMAFALLRLFQNRQKRQSQATKIQELDNTVQEKELRLQEQAEYLKVVNQDLKAANDDLRKQGKTQRQLQDRINAISRLEVLDDICKQAVRDMIEFFGFDYVSLSLLDPLKRRIEVKYNAKKEESLVDPEKWQGSEHDRGFELDAYDILPLTLAVGREVLVQGNVIDNKEFFSIEDSVLDEKIFFDHRHDQLIRGFFPMVRRSKDEEKRLDFSQRLESKRDLSPFSKGEDLKQGDTPIGVFEVGFHRSTNQLISPQKQLDLKLYIDNCAQPYFRAYLREEKERIAKQLKEYEGERNPEIYLKQCLASLSQELHADFGDAFLVPLDHDGNWMPQQTVSYQFPLGHLLHLQQIRSESPDEKKGVYAHIVESKESYWIDDVSDGNDPYFIREANQELNFFSILAHPLMYEEKVIGGICLYGKEIGQFDAVKARVLKKYCIVIGENLARKRVSQSIQALTKSFSIFSLEELGGRIGNLVHEYFLSPYVSVWAADEGEKGNLCKPIFAKANQQDLIPECPSVSLGHLPKVGKHFQVLEPEEWIRAFPELEGLCKQQQFKQLLFLPIGEKQALEGFVLIGSRTNALQQLQEVDELFLQLLQEKSDQSYTLFRMVQALGTLSQVSERIKLEEFLKRLCNLAVNLIGANPVTLFVLQQGQKLRFTDGHFAGEFREPRIEELYLGASPHSSKEVELANLILEKGDKKFSSYKEFKRFREGHKAFQGDRSIFKNHFWQREEIQSLIAIRLEAQGIPVGVMFFNFRKENPYQEETRQLIQAFAYLASSAIVSAKNVTQLQAETDEAQKEKEKYADAYFVVARGINHDIRNGLQDLAMLQIDLEDDLYPKLSNNYRKQFMEFFSAIQAKRNNIERLVKMFDFEQRRRELIDTKGIVLENIKEFTTALRNPEKKTHWEKHREIDISILTKNINSVPDIIGDPNMFHMVINNLLSNAIKAIQNRNEAQIEGNILIHNQSNPKQLILVIEDNGVGIPSELGEMIYQPYYSGREDGVGFGLFFVQEVTKSYFRGRVYHQSTVGRGTQFFLEIPI